jgi:membrane protease YdiL (CAAX protease family)
MLVLLKSVTTTLLQFAFLLPLMLLIKRDYSKKQKRLLILTALIILAESLTTSGFNATIFKTQQWNWVGKSASLVSAILFVYFNPVLSKKLIGFNSYLKPFSLYPVLSFVGTALLFRLIPKLISGKFNAFQSLETFAFQATLPGLSEEIIYRGIVMGLLTKVLPASITIFKAKIGWGVLIVSVMFGLVHGIMLDKEWHPLLNTQKFFVTTGLGFAFAWLKQRSGSLLPAVIFHNLWNLIVFS